MNTYVTEVMIRFQSGKSSGVIFYVEGEGGDDYVMLELFQRRLIFTVNMKGMLTITMRDGKKKRFSESASIEIILASETKHNILVKSSTVVYLNIRGLTKFRKSFLFYEFISYLTY